MKPPREYTIKEAKDRMRAGDMLARELVESCLERIRQREDTLHAWVEVYEDEALEAADVTAPERYTADAEIDAAAQGRRQPLHRIEGRLGVRPEERELLGLD